MGSIQSIGYEILNIIITIVVYGLVALSVPVFIYEFLKVISNSLASSIMLSLRGSGFGAVLYILFKFFFIANFIISICLAYYFTRYNFNV